MYGILCLVSITYLVFKPSLFMVIVAGQCVCEMCFTRNSSGQCQICSDYPFSNTLGECGVDDRPRQLTAFLLSLFLSSTGAANFYIGQTNLGEINNWEYLIGMFRLLLS